MWELGQGTKIPQDVSLAVRTCVPQWFIPATNVYRARAFHPCVCEALLWNKPDAVEFGSAGVPGKEWLTLLGVSQEG